MKTETKTKTNTKNTVIISYQFMMINSINGNFRTGRNCDNDYGKKKSLKAIIHPGQKPKDFEE